MFRQIVFVTCLAFFLSHCYANNKAFYCQEGAVSDLELINSPHGVLIDYSFNETNFDNDDGVSSVAGCPRSIEGYPWILYEIQPSKSSHREMRCFLAGSRGPCAPGRILFAQRGSRYGICGCECLLSESELSQDDTKRFQYCRSDEWEQIYDHNDKSVCYNALEQGPCPNGTVIAITGFNDGDTKTWNCLPVCDENDENAYEKYLKYECTTGGQATAVAFAENVRAHNCPSGEKYSKVLQKCIEANPKKHIMIG